MKRRKGGLLLWVSFMMFVIVFVSGAIAVYTVFMKPENNSKVPLFRGRSVSEAVSEAEGLGLVVQLEPVASTLPEGRVLAQRPEAGTELRKGQVIVLQISRGGELHAIPDVSGKTLAQAQAEIKSQGFSLGDVIRIKEPNTQAGTVIAQSPSAPAKVASGRRIDLLVRDGTAAAEVVTIPDVNRMTETEARSVLEAGGLKVSGVDRVYSPLLPEGLAIETRPGAGTTIRAGQGVILKLATQRRPAGFMDSDSTSSQTANGTANRVTSQQSSAQSDSTASKTPATSRGVTVSVRGQDDVFIGDDYEGSPTRPSKSATQSTASRTPAAATTPSATTQQRQTTTPTPAATQTPAATSTGGTKTARIRYQVPPIAQPMNLRIELTDPSGKRDVYNRQVRSGQNVVVSSPYTQECVISIYLDGEFVWQERQR